MVATLSHGAVPPRAMKKGRWLDLESVVSDSWGGGNRELPSWWREKGCSIMALWGMRAEEAGDEMRSEGVVLKRKGPTEADG
jgi:hypothetical protein